jgi:two-component system CheB/CheR fusion protein
MGKNGGDAGLLQWRVQMAEEESFAWDEEDAARFSELLLRQSKQHGIIFIDLRHRISGWSRGASFITGFTASEAIGQDFSLLFTFEDRESKISDHELDTAYAVGSAEDERWHVRKDGSRFWSSGISLPLRDAASEVTGFVKIFRDATHLRTRMRYLENQLQDHSDAFSERDKFLGTIAHELRNPLSPLKNSLTLLRATEELTARAVEPLKIMGRQLGLLERLVEDLVDQTRVATGKMSVSFDKVVVQALVNDAVEVCRASAAEHGVMIHTQLPSFAIDAQGDAERLHQVLVNLVTNAIKFTPAGGDVWVTASADQTHVLLYVKDNGVGISREMLPRIFEMFTQANGESHRGSGLGIGLAVAKEIVALHRGTIEVRSEGEGKGAEFTVRFPQNPTGASSDEARPEPPYDAQAREAGR